LIAFDFGNITVLSTKNSQEKEAAAIVQTLLAVFCNVFGYFGQQ
jgi:hypothetical protein